MSKQVIVTGERLTKASPTFNSVIAVATSTPGLTRNVSAALRTVPARAVEVLNHDERLKALAQEVASKGVTVNTVSPGYIGTDMVMAVKEEVRNQIIAQIPVGRLGGTEEVAYLVSFLASTHASYITGANLSINGGQHVY